MYGTRHLINVCDAEILIYAMNKLGNNFEYLFVNFIHVT